jgi:hypothetical protein
MDSILVKWGLFMHAPDFNAFPEASIWNHGRVSAYYLLNEVTKI